MATIYVSLYDDDTAPRIDVLQIAETGERFMNIHASDTCTITLPGRDHVTVKHAFALADAIVDAARSLRTQLEQELKAEVAS